MRALRSATTLGATLSDFSAALRTVHIGSSSLFAMGPPCCITTCADAPRASSASLRTLGSECSSRTLICRVRRLRTMLCSLMTACSFRGFSLACRDWRPRASFCSVTAAFFLSRFALKSALIRRPRAIVWSRVAASSRARVDWSGLTTTMCV
eukprot:1611171-Prymnesium_polylepis.1